MYMLMRYFVQALDLFRGKNYLVLMDSALDGQFSDEDRTELIHVASRCFKTEPEERPSIKFLKATLSRLQKRAKLCPINVKRPMSVRVTLSIYSRIKNSLS